MAKDQEAQKPETVTDMVSRAFGPLRSVDTNTLIAEEFILDVTRSQRAELKIDRDAARARLIAEG